MNVNADSIAANKNMVQASNMALLGFFSYLDIKPFNVYNIKNIIRKKIKQEFLEKNQEIFDSGYEVAQNKNICFKQLGF
jgi:Pyruvate/2-oxoacid:ferredoxin oxidoreductase gamma subunit